jgi:hypothetical protein
VILYELLRSLYEPILNNKRLDKTCAYCGKNFIGDSWPHVEGNSNLGVLKIENFCCEEHRILFLESI